jgi:hypothetical protein
LDRSSILERFQLSYVDPISWPTTQFSGDVDGPQIPVPNPHNDGVD